MNKIEILYKVLFTAFGPQHWWPGETPFEVAVGAILTQNTNWGNVEKAIDNLKTARMLSAKNIDAMPAGRLATLIRPAGYFNIKAKRLKSFISFLSENYHGSMAAMKDKDVFALRGELLSVSGIGPETADSILLYALDKPIFVIDAYTRRVLSRHRIMEHDKSYDEFQALFHAALRKDTRLFNEYHALFVAVGKKYCKPKPRCGECPIRNLRPISI